jgi:hypothetical protein
MASGDLSVALVIDTASGLTSQELAAVQSGAAEFLLRLPDGAHTMVVAAAREPEVVAPLSEHRAEALSAVSALREGGSRATMAATMLAAQSLESAPPGPRAIIIYAHGLDEQGVLATRLSQAVLHSEAVLNVIRNGTDVLWPSVVDQTGGGVVTTTTENIVQSFGDLAAMLGDQYLVTFEAPGQLPAVAKVAFQASDQEYSTVVNLPDAGAAQAAPTESSGGSPDRRVPWLVAPLVAGLVLTLLGVFLRRTRQLQPAYGGEQPTEMASLATGAPSPDKVAPAGAPLSRTAAGSAPPLPKRSASSPPAADKAARSAPVPAQAPPSTPPPKQPAVPTASLPDDPTQNDPPLRRPPTPPMESKPARSYVSAAIAGRRLARLILDSRQAPAGDEAVAAEHAETEEADEPEPQAAPGTRGNPLALGTPAQIGADYEIAVTEIIIEGANEIMGHPDLFNEPSEHGQYVIVTLEGKFLGNRYPEGSPGWDLHAVIVGSDATEYSDTDTPSTPPNDLTSGPILEASGEFSGNFVLWVPSKALDGALLFVEPLAALDNDQRAFWAVPRPRQRQVQVTVD